MHSPGINFGVRSEVRIVISLSSKWLSNIYEIILLSPSARTCQLNHLLNSCLYLRAPSSGLQNIVTTLSLMILGSE